jgi:hypothetical protein
MNFVGLVDGDLIGPIEGEVLGLFDGDVLGLVDGERVAVQLSARAVFIMQRFEWSECGKGKSYFCQGKSNSCEVIVCYLPIVLFKHCLYALLKK